MDNRPRPLPEFLATSVNLASARLGAKAVSCSDEFFAAKERMLEDRPAVFQPERYDDNGKWMDGWESRRRRGPGHDWCIVRLAFPGRLRGVDIDTSHFTGNYPPAASLEACLADAEPDAKTRWEELLPASPLGPSAHHYFELATAGVHNFVRLNILPDGGVARLRIHGDPVAAWNTQDKKTVHELSALANGGHIVGYNDAHYGTVWTLLSDGRGRDMGDGWETRRRREPGNDWIIVGLGAAGSIEEIEVDTRHYKGNFPDRCSLQAADVPAGERRTIVTDSLYWPEVLPPQRLEADRIHRFGKDLIRPTRRATHVKLNIYPDGGVSRLRIFGRLA